MMGGNGEPYDGLTTAELSPDELDQAMHEARPDSESPSEMTPDQLDAVHSTDKVDFGTKPELNPDELDHQLALSKLNGTYGKGPVETDKQIGFSSGNTVAAAKDFYANHDSNFRKILYSLNLPEQFLMRQVTAALAPMGLMPDEEAKVLLSQNELSPHDLLDYYWKPPEKDGLLGYASKAMHLAAGFMSDIIFDPLNMIAAPVTAAGKTVTIAGKTITGLEKMSEGQRAVMQTMGMIEKVITSDGKILHAGDIESAWNTVAKNMKMLSDARDMAQGGNPLGFIGLQQGLKLSEEGSRAAQNVILDGLTQSSAAEQLAAGTRELTIGIRIPFTNMAWETKMPGPLSTGVGKVVDSMGASGIAGGALGGLAAGPLGAVAGAGVGTAMNMFGEQGMNALNAMSDSYSAVRAMSPEQGGKMKALADAFALDSAYAVGKGIPIEAYRMWKNLWTKTTDLLFNSGMNSAMNLKGATAETLAKQTSQWNVGLAAVKERLGPERFKSIMDDFVNEAEKGIYTPEEAFAMAKAKGVAIDVAADKPPININETVAQKATRVADERNANIGLTINPLVLKLYAETPEQLARVARLKEHPELVGMLGDMRQQLKAMVGRYDERNIPFEEINPFGEGWMNRYVKHTFTNEWKQYLSSKAAAQDSWANSMRDSEELMGTFDESALGRKYRGGILDANEESMKKYGIKMFVDNPVQLFNMRVQEMQDAVAKHDLILSAMPGSFKNYNPGVGWMKANPADFGHMESMGLVGDEERKIYKSFSFLPMEFRSQLATNQNTYFRTDVYDRMLWMTQQQGSNKFTNTLAATDTYTWFWRNQILANTGYIGTKWFHNMLSYFGLMQNSNPEYIMKAASAVLLPDVERAANRVGEIADRIPGVGKIGFDMSPDSKYLPKMPDYGAGVSESKGGSIKFPHLQPDGTTMNYNREQILDLAQKHGVLGSGTEVLFDDVLDHMAASYSRDGGFSKAKSIANFAYMFGMYRGAAQWGDDIPKLAVFIQRLEQGFTAEAASESAARYFYNFKPVTAEQNLAKNLVPFISFPMKTAELVASQVRNGDLLELAMPGHVQQILQGRYVEDRDVRDYLTKTLPNMKNWYEPLHGGITPGMRSMSIELPWCYNTTSLLWNEEARMHPIFQLMSLGLAAKHDGTEMDSVTDEPTVKRVLGQQAGLVLPQAVQTALTLAALNGVKVPFGDALIERYQTRAPDLHNYMLAQTGRKLLGPALRGNITEDNPTGSPSSMQIQQSAMNEKFQNATDFGRWMDKSYGDSWLYNFLFHGSLKANEPGEYSDSQAGMRGEFIRQHFRQMTLGLGQLDKMDQTMLTKYSAIDREIKSNMKTLQDDAVKNYSLQDPVKAMSPDALKIAADKGVPEAKKILALMQERSAVIDWYNWNLGAAKKAPDFSIYKVLLGIDQFQMSSSGKPGPESSKALYPRNLDIPDDRAKEFWHEKVMNKWFPHPKEE